MGTFVIGDSVTMTDLLPDGEKSTAPGVSLRAGWSYDNVLRASEVNALANAALDLRTAVRLVTRYQGSATWDPGNLADGAGETSASVAVTGAALGDFAIASAPYDLQGITCTAYVDATDSVRIRLQNETGGPINLASGTWRVRVFKP